MPAAIMSRVHDVVRPERLGLWHRVLRFITRVFWIVGATADILGIYAFGELHHWWMGWSLPPLPTGIVSGEWRQAILMVALAVSYPWTMMVAGVLTVTVLRPLVRDRGLSNQTTYVVVQGGLIYAAYNCAKMVWGGRIKDEYMNVSSAVRINTTYFVGGIIIGLVLAAIGVILRHGHRSTPRERV